MAITIQDFLQKFAENFEEESKNDFNAATQFKEHDEWNSMQALIIIAAIDEVYDVTIDGEDIKRCKTLEDLYNIVVQKSK